ncbi:MULTISPECIES: DUF4845 domain-containing protein [Marichromatium]|uniref:Uncharacterized protein DUF4845 n=1 Tax=Marichromatium gracile TaxID=1048 RepID=A0A4R4A7S1_MARGR|nr:MULTISPECIES: DUF4845 domain-containing protein [Marichromatium]MBK1708951.1 hypothetical protein [Marichromatium gracile]RNE91387.1 DUF4845 domain-containing protein [Marichromatium sp. AB32]TCW34887.1 uncharacterized protein DUF4845 [Marichromatium gracile]
MPTRRCTTPARRQAGAGILSFTILVGLAAFFITLLLKLGPIYMQNLTIQSVMDGLEDPVEPVGRNPRKITDYLMRNLDINGITSVSAQEFVIKRTDADRFSVVLEYERRTHLFFNVDVVLTFHNQVEISTQ